MTLQNRPEAAMMAFDDGAKGKTVSTTDPLPVTGDLNVLTDAVAGVPTDAADIAVAAAVVTLLAANAARNGAMIQNTGVANMRVTVDGTAPTATKGFQVAPGQTLRLSMPYCPRTAIKAIREGGTSTTAFAEEVV